MKATLHLLFFLCTTSFLHAQSTEWNIQPQQFSEINAVKSTGSGKWLIGGTSISESNNRGYIFSKVDALYQSQSTINHDGLNNIEAFYENNNSFFCLTQKYNYKYIHSIYQNNTNANINVGYRLGEEEVVNKIVRLPNSKRVMVGYRMVNSEQMVLLKIFSNGFNLEYEDVFTKGYYSDIIVLDDSTYMVTGGIESNTIIGGRKYNQYHEMIGEYLPNLESDYFFEANDGGYFLVKSDVVTKLDQDMQVEHTANFASYGERINLESDEENIYMLFQSAGEAPLILRIDNSLQVEDSFSIEDEYFIANDMSLSEEEIGVGGFLIPNVPFNETPFPHTSTSGFFKTFSKDGISDTYSTDLEILDVQVEDHERFSECASIDLPETNHLNLKNINVTFVNRGFRKIINATIFIQALGIDDCSNSTPNPQYYFQQERLKLLRIEPGDTLEYRISAFEFPQAMMDSTSVKLCIWNTEVDNKKDLNPSDNYFCGEVVLKKSGYVEAPIIEPTEGEYLLFPNPVGTSMTVSLKEKPFEPTSIRFYDYLGRNIQNYGIAARATYKEFDTGELSSGIYFVRIKNDLIDEVAKVFVFKK